MLSKKKIGGGSILFILPRTPPFKSWSSLTVLDMFSEATYLSSITFYFSPIVSAFFMSSCRTCGKGLMGN